MPSKERIKFRTVTIVYKTLNGLTPSNMLYLFKLQINVSARVTRFNQKIKLYLYKLSVSRRSLSYLFNLINYHVILKNVSHESHSNVNLLSIFMQNNVFTVFGVFISFLFSFFYKTHFAFFIGISCYILENCLLL